MKEICDIPQQVNTEAAESEINNLLDTFETVYQANFGVPLFSKEAFKSASKKMTAKIKELSNQKRILKKQGASQELADVDKQILELGNKRSKYDRDYKNFEKKQRTLKKINKIIMDRLVKYAEHNVYDVNPHTQIPTIKEWISRQFTLPFNRLTDLDVNTLVSIANTLDKAFKKAEANAQKRKLEDGAFFELRDPASLLFETDVSLAGYKFTEQARSMTDNMYSKAAPHKLALSVALERLKHFANNSNKNIDDLIESVHKKLDRQEMYLIPKRVVGWDLDKNNKRPGYRFENLQHKKKYEEILERNIKQNWNAGGQIQKIEIDGRNSYFIPIKEVMAGGREIYYAYEVPYIPAGEVVKGVKIKNDSLMNPMKTYNAKQWLDFFSIPRLAPTYKEFASDPKKDSMTIGMMREGYYNSTLTKPMSGLDKDGESFTIKTYQDYEFKEDQSDVSDSEWRMVAEIRRIMRNIYGDITKTVIEQEAFLTTALNKAAKKKGISLSELSRKSKNDLNKILADVLGFDNINMNFYVNKYGKVISMNHHYNHVEDYITYRYPIKDILINSMEYRDALEVRISEKERDIAAIQDEHQDNPSAVGQQVIDKKLELEEMINQLQVIEDKIDLTVGLKSKEEIDHSKINQATQLKATMERGLMMEALPRYINKDGDITFASHYVDAKGRKIKNKPYTHGRRMDFDVLTEYIDDAYRQLEQNGLKINLIEAVNAVDSNTRDYLFDLFKRSVGRLDVKAGIFGFDLSDEKLAQILQPIMKARYGDNYKLTLETINKFGNWHSKIISASLLGWGSAMNNQFQRVSAIIEHGFKSTSKAMSYTFDNPEQAKQVADAMGTTDTLSAMADILAGATDTGGQGNIRYSIKDWTLLKLNKSDFIKAAMKDKGWNEAMSKLIQRMPTKRKSDTKVLLDGLEGIWNATHGLSDAASEAGGLDKLSKKQKQALLEKLGYIIGEDKVNSYVGEMLKGGFIYAAQPFYKSKAFETLVGFHPSELQMRIEVSVLGAMMAVDSGVVPSEYIEKHANNPVKLYTHPEAIKYGRILVYNTLFGLSPAFLPQAFSGFSGKFLFKFKPYSWHQVRNEWRVISNFYRSMNEDESKFAEGFKRLINPSPEDATARKLQRFFGTRGFITLMSTFLYTIPVIGPGIQAMMSAVPRTMKGSLMRGGQSVILATLFNTLAKSLYVTGLVDEEEELWEGVLVEDVFGTKEEVNNYLLYFLLPMGMTTAIDAWKHKDLLRPLQIYQRGVYRIADSIRDKILD